MAFTFNTSPKTDLDFVRLYLGDSVSGNGPKPGDGNFTDEELNGLLSKEQHWKGAVAAGFEILFALWSKHVTFSTQSGAISAHLSDIADRYKTLASIWRNEADNLDLTSKANLSIIRAERQDGYSNANTDA